MGKSLVFINDLTGCTANPVALLLGNSEHTPSRQTLDLPSQGLFPIFQAENRRHIPRPKPTGFVSKGQDKGQPEPVAQQLANPLAQQESFHCLNSGTITEERGVAQLGSAGALGALGRRFESCRPD